MRPNIGISLRITHTKDYDEKRDSLSHDWPKLMEELGINVVFIPNSLKNIHSYLTELNLAGFIISGGDNIGDDVERDKTEIEMIKFATKNKIPLFGVCRGMQIINKFFDGTISINEKSNHVGKHHAVNIVNKNFFRFFKNKRAHVNSFHNNLIHTENLGHDLIPFAATSEDGTVEGFFHKFFPIIGVMWHPERQTTLESKTILKHFFVENPLFIH
tara:strand:+ start:846 stop:1490 length:645 start_codon:yes stop_codon:yes gene_type:complete